MSSQPVGDSDAQALSSGTIQCVTIIFWKAHLTLPLFFLDEVSPANQSSQPSGLDSDEVYHLPHFYFLIL